MRRYRELHVPRPYYNLSPLNYVLYRIPINVCKDFTENIISNDSMFTNKRVCYKINPMTDYN